MSTTLIDEINNTKLYADRAAKDKNGFDIPETYAAKGSLAPLAFTGSWNDLHDTPAFQSPLDSSDSTTLNDNSVNVNLVNTGAGQNISGLTIDPIRYQGSDGQADTFSDMYSDTKTYYSVDSLPYIQDTYLRLKIIGGSYTDALVYLLFVQGSQYSDITSASAYGTYPYNFWMYDLFADSGREIDMNYYSGTVDFSQPFMVFFLTSSPTGDPKSDVDSKVALTYSGGVLRLDYPQATPVSTRGLKVDADQVKSMMNLATVATSGSYTDLSNKPTIPTYSAGTGISISSGTISADTTVLATKSELPAGVPAVTSSDDDKVLKASYSGGSGSYAWEAEPTIIPLTAGSNVTITEANNAVTIAATDTTYTAGNMISINANNSNAIGVSTTAGITDIQQVAALPANPVSTVLYLIPET